MTGLFVPLDASYAQDPKVLDLDDERAELLFVRGLAYCKAHLTDGHVHRRALAGFAPFVDEVPPTTLAAELVRVGLWTVTDRGWFVTAWLKRNLGSEEILSPSKGRELAHVRHHANKGVLKEGCPFCFPAETEPQVITHDACVDAVRTAQHAMPETEPYTEPEPEPEPSDNDSEQPQLLEQTVNRAVGIYARTIAARTPGVTDLGAYAAGIGRAIEPAVRDELRDLIAAGTSPEDAAATVADSLHGLDVAGTPHDPEAAARTAEAARKREAESAAKIAELRDQERGDARAGLAEARAAL